MSRLPPSPDASVDRRALLGLAGAAVGAALLPGPAAGAEVAGRVASLSGRAQAEAAGAIRALAVGEVIHVAETVSTGDDSRLALQLGPATMVNLGARTRLKIDRYLLEAGGELNLISGGVLFDRKSEGPPRADTVIRSAYGLMAVRGTRFFAGMSRGVFGVFVEHGRVDVTGGGRTVRVTAGLGTDIARRGGRPTAPHRWGEARIAEAIASVT